MPKKPYIFVEYKFPYDPWIEYDRTQDAAWAAIQFNRMREEFPTAEHRLEKRVQN